MKIYSNRADKNVDCIRTSMRTEKHNSLHVTLNFRRTVGGPVTMEEETGSEVIINFTDTCELENFIMALTQLKERDEYRNKVSNNKGGTRMNVKNKYGKEIDFDEALKSMDADLRESVAYELSLSSDQEFFDKYAEAHKKNSGPLGNQIENKKSVNKGTSHYGIIILDNNHSREVSFFD